MSKTSDMHVQLQEEGKLADAQSHEFDTKDYISMDIHPARKKESMKKTALEFMKSATGRIVSSGDLTEIQIVEFRAYGSFYIDDETGLGWADVSWELTTDKDRKREFDYFTENKKHTLLPMSPN